MKGQLVSPNKLIVDIGTGYYVEMSSTRAVDFYRRKSEFVRNQLTVVREHIDEKSAVLQVLTETLQKKIAALSASQQQPPPQQAVQS